MTTSAPTRATRSLVAGLMALVAVLAVAVIGLTGCAGSSSSPKTANVQTSAQRMATIAESALPTEARDVIRSIDTGGGFKYRQDGVTFQNREGLLPQEPQGYYREFTVTTPGAQDRGARRLILGRQGELYYTPDHYRSFFLVVRGGAS